MNTSRAPELALFPLAAEVNNQGHHVIGGCDVVDLAEEFDTSLYLFGEPTLRHKCRECKEEFCKYYPDTLVTYACKAFLNRALALIFKEEGLGLSHPRLIIEPGNAIIGQAGVAFIQGGGDEEDSWHKEIRLC